MALGPINYQMQVATPFESVLQGMRVGAQMADIEAARAKQLAQAQAAQQAVQRQQAFENAKQSYFANPSRTGADFDRLLAQAPDKQALDALKAAGESAGAERIGNAKRFYGQLLSAIEVDPNIAKQIVDERIAGEQDPNNKRGMEVIRKALEISPEFALEQVELLGGAGLGKDWIDSVAAARKARQDAKLSGSGLREATAKADKAVAEAITAQATATNAAEKAAADAALAKANAAKAGVEADFARQNALADLEKKAADLGLTKAQTNSAIAQTRKLGVEISKAAIELEGLKASGGVDPSKKFDQEEKIRKEWQGRSKVYSELGSTFSNIQASAEAKTGPGDIALITGFMKMLDPGSVVRETEFATARDTAGLFDRLANQAQKLRSGQIFSLDSKQRQEYVTLARQYLDAAQKKAEQEKRDLGVVVKNYALNPENVFGIRAAEPSPAASQPAAIPGAAPGQRAPAPASGQRNVTVPY